MLIWLTFLAIASPGGNLTDVSTLLCLLAYFPAVPFVVGAQSNQSAVMLDPTGQQDVKIKSVKSGLPEEPAPIAVYAATPFNANTPASSKQPITAPGAEEKTDFKYFQRQVSCSFTLCPLATSHGHPSALSYMRCKHLCWHV